MKKRKKACLLIRVSTKSESQKSSIANQIEMLSELIYSLEEYDFDPTKDIYSDRFTGTKIKRKNKENNGFDRLMELQNIEIVDIENEQYSELSVKCDKTKKPFYDLIVCKSTSRFSRASFKGEVLQNSLTCELYFYDLGKTLNQLTEEEKKIYSLLDNKYSRNVSYNYRNIYKRRAINKKLVCKDKVYGFDRVYENGDAFLEPNEEERKIWFIVKDLYENKEYGYQKIADYLTFKGYKSIKGGNFNKSTIKRMLSSPTYCGYQEYYIYPEDYLYQFAKGKDYLKTLPKKLEKCDYIKEPFETFEDYKARQELINSKSKKLNGVKVGIQPPKTQISKLCICGLCGNGYYSKGKTIHEDSRLFRCSSKKHKKEFRIECNSRSFYESYFYECAEKYSKEFSGQVGLELISYVEVLNLLRLFLFLSLDKDTDEEIKDLEYEKGELEKESEEIFELTLNAKSESIKNKQKERMEKVDNQISKIEKKLKLYEDHKRQIKLFDLEILSSLEEISKIAESIKITYTVEEMLSEIQQIKVFPKTEKMKRNNVRFEYTTKYKNIVNQIIDKVLESDLINLIDDEFLDIVDNFRNQDFKERPISFEVLSEEERKLAEYLGKMIQDYKL